MSGKLRKLSKADVIDICQRELRTMEAGRFWGPAMVDRPFEEKCRWMLAFLHTSLRVTHEATFSLSEALGWTREIAEIYKQGDPL